MSFDLYNIILILICLFFACFGLFFSKNDNTLSSYLNAGRSIQSSSLTASIVASCFGVWILIGPSEAATWGGMGAVIGYAFGQACPYLAMNILGPRLRAIMPNGNSLTQFVFARYGKSMLQLILMLSVFYMFIYLCAEVTAIAKVVQLISGTALWKTSLIILVSTLIYTLKGGLRISILTDKFQFVIISIFLVLIFYYLFFSGKVVIDTNLIASRASVLIDPKYFYGYTAGVTFFIAVFATNLFDQGIWQRVFAACSTGDLKKGFKNSFFIVLPVILLLGFCGIVAVSLGQTKDPSTIIFSLLLTNGGKFLTISILILTLTLVISSMDTLINAISSLIIIDGNKIMPFHFKLNYFYFSKFFLIGLSILIFFIASKGLSVLYMFLLADLLCCAAVFPVFYGMFKQDINSKIALLSVAVGLIGGLLFFPNLTFEKSILVGLLFESSLFPTWISTALLFWSFVVATILPLLTLLMLRKKNITYNFTKIKNFILEIY